MYLQGQFWSVIISAHLQIANNLRNAFFLKFGVDIVFCAKNVLHFLLILWNTQLQMHKNLGWKVGSSGIDANKVFTLQYPV